MATTTLHRPPVAPSRAPWWRWEGIGPPGRRPLEEPGDGHAGGEPGAVVGVWSRATLVERLIAIGVVALLVAWVPDSQIGSWPPEMAAALLLGVPGIPLLVARAVGRHGGRPPAERWAARALVGWLAVGLTSALLSLRPALALVGGFNQGTGWVFMVILAGAWALGTTLGATGRRLVGSALVAGAVANGVVALVQMFVGLSRIGLPSFGNGQPLGFQGNPVFLGGIEVGAFAIVAARFADRPRRSWLPGLLIALTIGAAGERMSMLGALVVALAVPAWSWWQRTHRHASAHEGQPGAPAGECRPWRGLRPRWPGPTCSAVVFGVLGVVAIGGGTLLPLIRSTSVLDRQLSESAEGTFGDRLHAWFEGARALLQHPLLGAGPGQFRAATSALFPAWFVRTHPGEVFTDAHNIVVEYAVTTGVVGVVLLAAWAAMALWGRSGALFGFVLAAGVVELIEPLNPVLTPLIFLAVGGASSSAWLPRRRRRTVPVQPAPLEVGAGLSPAGSTGVLPGGSTGVSTAGSTAPTGSGPGRYRRALVLATVSAAVVAGLLAADLLVGTQALATAQSERLVAADGPAWRAATLADDLLAPWPEPAQQLALIASTGRAASRSAPLPLAVAARWDQIGAERDPSDSPLWASLAGVDMRLGRLSAAARADLMALHWYPWDAEALEQQGLLALARHDRTRARYWFERLVVVQPRPTVATLMRGGCPTSRNHPVGSFGLSVCR